MAAQDQTLRTRYYEHHILHRNVSPTCCVCSAGLKTVDHIVADCSAIAPMDYTDRHNQVASSIHWNICRQFQVPVESRWYRHQPDRLVETDDMVMMWDMTIPTAGKIKPTDWTSVSETRRLALALSLIPAVLHMATLVGSMLRSWQSMVTCGWRKAACANVRPRWFPWYWEQCTQVLHNGWTLFQVTTTCSTYRKQCFWDPPGSFVKSCLPPFKAMIWSNTEAWFASGTCDRLYEPD